jgi:hypothetical protein
MRHFFPDLELPLIRDFFEPKDFPPLSEIPGIFFSLSLGRGPG